MKQTVLLIEDDLWLVQLYSDALSEDSALSVRIAGSAEEALNILDEGAVELIVLDMFLPGHNGIEFLHEISSYDDLNTVPIVVLTSVSPNDLGMSKERWRDYGVVEYLYKPNTKPHDLLAAVKKQLVQA